MGISELLPRNLRDAFIAAADWPQHLRIDRIDKLTDEAAAKGLARERTDCSRATEWQRRRDAMAAAVAAVQAAATSSATPAPGEAA
jgi:hypothetical protein